MSDKETLAALFADHVPSGLIATALARLVIESDWLADAVARAWDEGYDDGYDADIDAPHDYGRNPYRAGEVQS